MSRQRDASPNDPPRSSGRRILAMSAYGLAVVVTLVSMVDIRLVLSVSLFLYDHGMGLLGRLAVFGIYALEFAAFLIFRRLRIGNRYLSLVMMCLSCVPILAVLLLGHIIGPAMPGPM